MRAEYLVLSGHKIFVRYRMSEKIKPTVLFLHGIGESGRCFFYSIDYLHDYNIIIPDLFGFGKSEKVIVEPDYSFSYQLKLLWELIRLLDLDNVVLVGHSYGGILGTLMCRHDSDKKISKFVNVEGGISRSSTIESRNAVNVLKDNNNDIIEFGNWLHEGGFKHWLLEDLESASTVKYFDSVLECDPEAFAQTATEICNTLEQEDDLGCNEVSEAYRDILIPKIFCVGTRPAMDDTKRFLYRNELQIKEFNVLSHWIMLDKCEEFYSFLNSVIAT